MRNTPASPPLSVLLTVAGFPPRASAHFLISSWSVVVLDDAPAIRTPPLIQCRRKRQGQTAYCRDETLLLENNSTIALLKAGRSFGLRLLTQFPSRTISWSTHVPPALRISSWIV